MRSCARAAAASSTGRWGPGAASRPRKRFARSALGKVSAPRGPKAVGRGEMDMKRTTVLSVLLIACGHTLIVGDDTKDGGTGGGGAGGAAAGGIGGGTAGAGGAGGGVTGTGG